MKNTFPIGLYIEVRLEDNTRFRHTAITSIAEGIYLMKRRYMKVPGMKRVSLFRGTKTQTVEIIGGNNMGIFGDFEEKYPTTGGVTFAKAVDKETLVAFGLCFSIERIIEAESKFVNELTGEIQRTLNYDIVLDTNDENYQIAQRLKDVKPRYRLSLPSNEGRRLQVEKLIQPMIDSGTEIRVKLEKDGTAYKFGDAGPSRKPTTKRVPDGLKSISELISPDLTD